MKDSIHVTIIDREGQSHQTQAPLGMNMNFMELTKAMLLPVEGTCGGMALCASCHVYIESDHIVSEMSEEEEDMLDAAFFVKPNSRLSCQLQIKEELDGIILRLAPVHD